MTRYGCDEEPKWPCLPMNTLYHGDLVWTKFAPMVGKTISANFHTGFDCFKIINKAIDSAMMDEAFEKNCYCVTAKKLLSDYGEKLDTLEATPLDKEGYKKLECALEALWKRDIVVSHGKFNRCFRKNYSVSKKEFTEYKNLKADKWSSQNDKTSECVFDLRAYWRLVWIEVNFLDYVENMEDESTNW